MFYAHLPALVIVQQVLLPGELPHYLHLNGGGDVFVGGEVIRHHHHPLPVEDLLGSHLAEGHDGQGRGDVIAQGDVHPGQDQLSGFHEFLAGMGRQNLFRYGLRLGHISFHFDCI